MNKDERNKYNKKIKIYERLGAEKFQKVVFKVEKIKFKIIKKIFPNFIKKYDKFCDFNLKRALKKAKTKEEKYKLIEETKYAKMAMRKELNQEKNRNYHLDSNKPTEIIKYLEWNKSVHIEGLIKNIVLIISSVIGITFGLSWLIPLLIYEVLSGAINFECINIQNCSICKYKKCQKILEKKERKKISHDIENYKEASEVISNAIEQSENLPTFSEIIGMIQTKEQLEQMKKMLLENKNSRESKKIGGKV